MHDIVRIIGPDRKAKGKGKRKHHVLFGQAGLIHRASDLTTDAPTRGDRSPEECEISLVANFDANTGLT